MPGTWRSESPAPPGRRWPSSAGSSRRIGSPWGGWRTSWRGRSSSGGAPGGATGGGAPPGGAPGRGGRGALLAEGLLEKLDPATVGPVEHDSYGNVRLSELELARLLKERVTASLRTRGIEVSLLAKDVDYELRCAPPGGFDIQYCRSLGYWAIRFLLDGGSEAMVTIQGGKLLPMRFAEIIDPTTGRVRVRYVDVTSEMYQTLYAYMIRLKPQDLADRAQVGALARAGNLTEAEFVAPFSPLVLKEETRRGR